MHENQNRLSIGRFFDRIPGIGYLRREARRQQHGEVDWNERYERWQREYITWNNKFNNRGEDSFPSRVNALATQLRETGSNRNSATIMAEERINMERFCELGLVVPIEGATEPKLQALGFRFGPKAMSFASGIIRTTEYPIGWHLEPSSQDRLDLAGSRSATAFDDHDQARISIFWSDSATRGREFQASAQILPRPQLHK